MEGAGGQSHLSRLSCTQDPEVMTEVAPLTVHLRIDSHTLTLTPDSETLNPEPKPNPSPLDPKPEQVRRHRESEAYPTRLMTGWWAGAGRTKADVRDR